MVRLWIVGAANNLVRWLEFLAAGVFTFEVTGSGLAVAVVTAARPMPLLVFGALAGVLSDAVDRRLIQIVGLLVVLASSTSVGLLAWLGVVRPWHIAVAAFVSGCVWSTDMSTRRRMVGEAAAAGMVARVVAIDSLAGAVTRMAGPVIGTTLYAAIGLRGAFACSAAVSLVTLFVLVGVHNVQARRAFALARVGRDLADGFAAARRVPAVRAVLGATVALNLFAFSYTALVAPIGLVVFAVPVAWVGLLASAEPLGSIMGGLALAGRLSMPPRRLLLGGAFLYTIMLAAMPFAPSFALACALLVVAGVGLAGFTNMQTTLILANTPAALRSRMLGLTTVCMGTGPLGLLLIGALAEQVGPMMAVRVVTSATLVALVGVTWDWVRKEGQGAALDPPKAMPLETDT